MDRQTRASLKKALQEAGIEVPEDASFEVLQALLNSAKLASDKLPIGDSIDDENDLVENAAKLPATDGGNDVDKEQNSVIRRNAARKVEEEEIDDEIVLLTKRLRIIELRQQLDQLEQRGDVNTSSSNHANFVDMETALPTYTADDDALSVRDFFADFESVLALCEGAGRNKLLWLRRSLQGTAKLFLSTTSGLNYEDLKEELIKEFGTHVRRHDVYQKLANRHWKEDSESIHAYILTMQAIAKRSRLDETEVLQFILEGLQDKVAHIDLLMSAQSIDQLKRLVERYQNSKLMLPKRSFTNKIPRSTMPVKRAPQNAAAVSMPNKSDVNDPLCYNCSKYGHIKPNCPYPLRSTGSCFKCWKMGHDHRNCPNPRKVLIPVRDVHAVHEDDDDCDGDEARNLVSVAFNCGTKRSAISKQLFSLFDTGSPYSFIQSFYIPNGCHVYSENKWLKGVGGGSVKIEAAVCAEIKFKNKTYYVKLLVVPNNAMNTPLIFGRDFLNKNRIKLMRTKLVYVKNDLIKLKVNGVCCTSFGKNLLSAVRRFDLRGSNCAICTNVKTQVPDIFNIEIDATDDLDTGHNLTADDRGEIRDMIKREYINKCANVKFQVPDIFNIETDIANELDAGFDLSVDERIELKNIIKEAYINSNKKNSVPLSYKMKIHLTSDVPFHCAPRRLSYAERENVRKIIEELKAEGIIRPSNSPYASAIVLVKKKNGKTRLCVDYRNLNKLTVRDNFPLPLIEDCIDYLEGKSIFSVLDLKNGFHHVALSEESVQYTAFVTPDGQYEYVYMPFGLKNAPAVFQRFINKIFEDLIRQRKIMIYLDDIVIASSNLAEHKLLLKEVLERISTRGLQLNLAKCKFAFAKIDYLGYSVSAEGISLSDMHISAIKNYPMPSNYKQLHSCIGLFSYFRRFVPSFSKIAKPLLNLLKKNVLFNFDEACVRAFDELKSRLITAPVLSIFNPSKETELHCDASSIGFGAVLLQRQDDGKLHPTAYFSKTTSAAESKYHSFELETLAIIYALKRFRIYLEGIPFIIVTDCISLALTLGRKQVNARIARWALELENYNYKIMHRSGSHMPHVDALSRCQICALFDVGKVDFQIQVAQELDLVIKAIKDKLETDASVAGYSLVDGLVCKKNADGRHLLYVPSDMQNNVIRVIHEKLGHFSVDKTSEEILRLYWFPNLREKVTKFIRNCLKCIMYSAPLSQKERNLYSIPKEPLPFDTLHIDHFGPLPSLKSKRKHILVVIDSFTKYVKLYATNSTSSREVIAALSKYFSYYSRPKRIISDRGTCFTSNEFGDFMSKNNIKHVHTAVSSPQANGQVERVNRVLKGMLSKLSDSIDHSDWTKKLEHIEFAMNNSVHSSTKFEPSVLLFGVRQHGAIVDEFSEHFEEMLNDNNRCDLETIRQAAAINIQNAQVYNEEYFLRHSKAAKKFNIGDVVVVRNVDTTVGQNKKLNPTYKGPYIVHKVLGNDRYVVRDLPNCQITQLPYDGVIEANRIRKWLLLDSGIESGP